LVDLFESLINIYP